MTAKELLRYQLDDALYQLEKVLEGLDGSHVDGKPIATAMSLRETVVHLAEAYTAAKKQSVGEKHSWGTFTLPSDNWHELVERFFALRAEAVEAALGMEDEDAGVKEAHSFILAHDYYHVGQIAAIRLSMNREFDTYAIYR